MRNALLATIMLMGCVGDDAPQAADETMTGTSEQELSSSLVLGTTLVTTDYLNLRSGPSTSDSILEVLPPGTRVSVVYHTSPSGGFYNILAGTRVGWSSGLYLAVATPPAAHTLDTSVVAAIVEPPGSGDDSHGNYYVDSNYWNFCSPGAATAVLATFGAHVTTWPAGYFTEPYGPHKSTTYWTASEGRAYLLHIAMQSKPPNFSSPGLADFNTYPTHGGSLTDARDVINWEASGHSASYGEFFYEVVSASGLASATLHHDVKRDIWGGHAVYVTVNTAYLPNWSRSLGHAIAIVGYDDTAGTYAYVDTCGKRCNGSVQSTNGGVWHISQTRMYEAITSFGAGYAR